MSVCWRRVEAIVTKIQQFCLFVWLLFTKFWREIYKGIKKTAWRHIAGLLIKLFTKRAWLGLI
jgi:hypothetical protein